MTLEKEIRVDPKYARRQVVIEGHFRGSLSPFDIPSKAKIRYDEKQKRFRVDFEYLTPQERRLPKMFGKNNFLWVGRESGKLYAIEIRNIEKAEIPSIRIDLIQTIGQLVDEKQNVPENYVARMNLGLAKEFLDTETEIYVVK